MRGTKYLWFVWLAMALSGIVIVEPAPVDIAVVLLFLGGFWFSFLKYPRYVNIPLIFLWIFVLGNIAGMFATVDEVRGMRFLGITIYLILSWLFLVGLLTRFGGAALKIVFSGYLVAALFSAVSTTLAFLGLIPSADLFLLWGGRATGFFKDPNVFGPFLIPVSLYAILKFESSTGRARLWWIGVYLVITIGVLLSFSRAAWLNYLIALFGYMVLRILTSTSLRLLIRRYIFYVMAGCLVIIFSLSFLSFPRVNTLFFQRIGFQSYDQDRVATQKAAVENVLQNPMGIGSGQSEIVYNYATHSLYVRVLTEDGFIGFMGFLGFVVVTFARSIWLALRRGHSYQPFFALFAASLLGVFLNSFVVDSIHWRHLWLLLAFPWAPYED